MSDNNPYQAPQAEVETSSLTDPEEALRLVKMAKGQKLVIYAVLLYIVSALLRIALGPLVLILVFISLILSLIGLFKVLSARQSHILVKIILFALLFVPGLNILILLSINSRATKALRDAGYKVGLMGASMPTPNKAK